jgi:hypothetical protein
MLGEVGHTEADILSQRRRMKPTLFSVIRFYAPGYIATAGVTRHVARQKPQVLRELYDQLVSLNRNVRNISFVTPYSRSAACAYNVLRKYGISSSRLWNVPLTEMILTTITSLNSPNHTVHRTKVTNRTRQMAEIETRHACVHRSSEYEHTLVHRSYI